LFLIPQAIAVAEFGKRYPEEGGIYLWTKEMYGPGHAFLSGWCYWTNNLFYIPSILFILVGILVYAGGPNAAVIAENKIFMAVTSIVILWFIAILHIRGLGTGKWLNNLGAFGTWLSLVILLIIGVIVLKRTGAPATPFSVGEALPSLKDYAGLSAFSITLYSLVGLELGPVMGDEIKNPEENIRKSALIGGAISIVLYLIGTAALLIAVSSTKVGAIQGLMQAVTVAASELGLHRLIPVVSILMATAVLGICSAWLAGSARIPFVMGLEVYLPKALGRTHPVWGSPYVALLIQGVLSTIFILISLFGSNVRQAYEELLKSSVVIQLIPFLYLFAGLWKLGKARLLASLGFIATSFGILFVFIPSSSVENIAVFEIKLLVGTFGMFLLAWLFFRAGARKKRTA
jgi:amino acid transporter